MSKFSKNNMEKAECSREPLYVCSETSFQPFSMRQYVLLSRQKNMFQNWPFAEKYLNLCLKYGVTNVLPPLECQGSTMEISYGKGMVRNAGDNDHKASFAATISMVCEQVQLMSLSDDDHNQKKEILSDMYHPKINKTNIASVNPASKTLARKRGKSRRLRRKFKSMAEIYASAKHRTLEEVDEMYDLNCTSEIIRDTQEQMQKIDQVDSISEITDNTEDYYNGLSKHCKRRRVLKPWRKSSSSSHEASEKTKVQAFAL